MSVHQNPSESFHLWEKEILQEQSTTPEVVIENIIINSSDVLNAAINLAEYAKDNEFDLQHSLISECVHKLNYYFMGKHVTDVTTVTINGNFGNPGYHESNDMADLLIELQKSKTSRVAGRLGFFENHIFEDNRSGLQIPKICLRMYDAAFLKNEYNSIENVESSCAIEIPNFVTIPVQNIEEYQIFGKEL